ncbi:MAG: type II secretion system protein [bacterium]
MVAINKAVNKIAAAQNGFSLLETVITIIIIGLAMGAIVESFIAGSAKSVNIVNEETAINVAKQITAELNYCRNGWSVSGVCNAFTGGTWSSPSSFYTTPQGPTNISNECFYTAITASCVGFNDMGGTGKIVPGSCPPKTDYIQTIVKTGWFTLNSGGTCPSAPASYPSVTVSTIFANY